MAKQYQLSNKRIKSRTDLVSYLTTLSLIGLTTFSASILSISPIHAEAETVDDITIIVPSTCTMGGTIVQGEEHTTSLQPGTYESEIGKTTLTTYCNDSEGFSIYAIGFTGDQVSGENHTKLIGNNASNTISTGLTTGTSSSDASSWAMKLSAVAGTYAPTIMDGTNGTEDFTNYHVVPDTYTKVATYGNTTDAEGDTGSILETTYAVYASLTQPADTYTGKVKYTLVHPASEPAPITPQSCTTGKICYFANVSDYEGTMADQDIAASVTLLPSNFSRTGYGFAGWSDKFDYATNPEAKFYGPMETITLNTADYTGTNPGLSLYAVWVKSQGNLQDSAKVASVCSSLDLAPIDGTANLSSVSALTDERDDNTYAIAKLADGKCWMIENLRLADKDSSNNDIELSVTNTNSPSLPLTNVYSSSTTSNHLSASTNPTSTAWCTSGSAACYDQSMLYNGNTIDRATTPAATNANTYSYGNYYNWYSATAGNGKYSTSTNNSTVAGDICPTGWTLPESGNKTNMAAEKNNFYKLSLSLGLSAPANYSSSSYPYWTGSPEGSNASIAFRTYPNNFLYSGNVSGSSVSNRGSSGSYWSKSAYSSYGAYSLNFNSSDVNPSYGLVKYSGFSVRCLAQ